MTDEKDLYCPICKDKVKKYGKRKGDLWRTGWVFCPVHGWIQEEEMTSKSLSEAETNSEHSAKQEVTKSNADVVINQNDLVMNKSTSIFKRVLKNPAMFIVVLLAFLVGYLVWKSLSTETIDIKPERASISVKEPAQQAESLAVIPPKETNTSTEKAESQKDIEVNSLKPKEQKKVMYTVQAGAFKKASNAQELESRLNRKGYNAFTILSESKEKGKLYKVYIGKFVNREEAKFLSEKINKIEDLQTFVTLK